MSIATTPNAANATVSSIMSSNLLYVRSGTRVALARKHIIDFGVSAVPVLDETHRPIGVVSLRDLASENGDHFEPSGTVAAVKASATLYEGARTLAESGCHHLVVVDDLGVAVGMVSSIDFVRAFVGLPPKHPTALAEFA